MDFIFSLPMRFEIATNYFWFYAYAITDLRSESEMADIFLPENRNCAECGMHTHLGEYHPYAACLMFMGCSDAETVRTNLDAITTEWRAIGRRAAEHERRRTCGPL